MEVALIGMEVTGVVIAVAVVVMELAVVVIMINALRDPESDLVVFMTLCITQLSQTSWYS